MAIPINIDSEAINNLDLSPAQKQIEKLLESQDILAQEQQLTFTIDYPRPETDPRELSEIPEIRLWFLRLDSQYPWLPLFLDWKSGELTRYLAMQVPHQFSRAEGIQFNPEALEIFVMKKIFVITNWLKNKGLPSKSRLQAMAQTIGYELDDNFFSLIS
ncbi:MAG: CRR6 family NdhI maturation factor [Spirulinaceae cyanobacterium]